MDNDLLDSCSHRVQTTIEHLEENATENKPSNAITFHILDQVDSDRVQEFLSEWKKTEYKPGRLVYEQIDNLIYLLKLEKKYNPETWNQCESLQQFAAVLKSTQTVDGEFRISDYEHVGGMWFMTLFAPRSEVTLNAVQYFISNFDHESQRSIYDWHMTSIGLIALSELNIHAYESIMNDIGDKFSQSLTQRLNLYHKRREKGEQSKGILSLATYMLIALNRIPSCYPDLSEEVGGLIQERWSRLNFQEVSNRVIAHTTTGLIANGEGPKIPISTAEWQKEREKQRFRSSQPAFVTTLPTTKLQTRREEIHNKAKNIINDIEDELRISTLRIDMLYDEIIDLAHDTEVNVKILSRQEAPTGDRKRLKKAVINELIRNTKDEVRGDDLTHARMIIGDQDELLVSSADLTRDQLYDQFNAGIYTQDTQAISNAIEMFDKVWTETDPLDIIH